MLLLLIFLVFFLITGIFPKFAGILYHFGPDYVAKVGLLTQTRYLKSTTITSITSTTAITNLVFCSYFCGFAADITSRRFLELEPVGTYLIRCALNLPFTFFIDYVVQPNVINSIVVNAGGPKFEVSSNILPRILLLSLSLFSLSFPLLPSPSLPSLTFCSSLLF